MRNKWTQYPNNFLVYYTFAQKLLSDFHKQNAEVISGNVSKLIILLDALFSSFTKNYWEYLYAANTKVFNPPVFNSMFIKLLNFAFFNQLEIILISTSIALAKSNICRRLKQAKILSIIYTSWC